MRTEITDLAVRILREAVAPVVLLLAALLFLWEEVLWLRLGRAMALAGRLGPVARAEATLRRLSPVWALVAFLAAAGLTYPSKLIALWLIASGHFWSGVVLLAALEILAAAVLARIYGLSAPALRSFAWFARAEATLLRWSRWAHRVSGLGEMRQAIREAAGDPAGDGKA